MLLAHLLLCDHTGRVVLPASREEVDHIVFEILFGSAVGQPPAALHEPSFPDIEGCFLESEYSAGKHAILNRPLRELLAERSALPKPAPPNDETRPSSLALALLQLRPLPAPTAPSQYDNVRMLSIVGSPLFSITFQRSQCAMTFECSGYLANPRYLYISSNLDLNNYWSTSSSFYSALQTARTNSFHSTCEWWHDHREGKRVHLCCRKSP